MNAALRVVALALLYAPALTSGSIAVAGNNVAKRHPTVCALQRDSAIYSRHFVSVSGRLGREAGGFVLLDSACAGAVLMLKGSPHVLELTCDDKERKLGLTCLFEDTKQPITITIGGIYSPAVKANGAGTVEVWAVSDVSLGGDT